MQNEGGSISKDVVSPGGDWGSGFGGGSLSSMIPRSFPWIPKIKILLKWSDLIFERKLGSRKFDSVNQITFILYFEIKSTNEMI